MTKVTVNLPPKTVETLQRLASRNGTTVTEALRQAIENHKFLLDEMAKGNRLLLLDPGRKLFHRLVLENSCEHYLRQFP